MVGGSVANACCGSASKWSRSSLLVPALVLLAGELAGREPTGVGVAAVEEGVVVAGVGGTFSIDKTESLIGPLAAYLAHRLALGPFMAEPLCVCVAESERLGRTPRGKNSNGVWATAHHQTTHTHTLGG